MKLGALGHGRTLEHLLHEVDAAARAVELVAEHVVRRARREAEAAVHALAQDRVGLEAARRILDPVGELGLHRQNSYMRPGLRMPAGSNATLSRLWILASAGRSGWKTSAPSPPRKIVACPPRRSTEERRSSVFTGPGVQRNPPPHSTSCAFGVSTRGAVCGSDRRHRTPGCAKNGRRCSRSAFQ